jgi:prepilin-type N-terminal cleavage/methylation domain-containing protein
MRLSPLPRRRDGFSLIELLVVIAIIAGGGNENIEIDLKLGRLTTP